MTEGDGEGSQRAAGSSDASAALTALLRRDPRGLLAAMASEGALVPLPDSVPRFGQSVFTGHSGLDLIIDEDHGAVMEGWRRAQSEPIVQLEVHLLATPELVSRVHLFDLRADHGVHVIVLEQHDPEVVLRSTAARAARRHGVARVKRDGLGVFLEVDAVATALLGWDAADLVGHPTLEFVHPDDVPGAVDSWMAMRAGTGSGRARVRFRQADGTYRWLEVSNENRLNDQELRCVLSDLVDISEEMAQLEVLRDREQLLARLAEALPIGVCHLRPDREVAYANEALVALLGAVDGVDALIRSVAGPDREVVGHALAKAFEGRDAHIEVGVLRGREERRCELTFRTMTSATGTGDGVIVCAADVTDRSRLRAELEHRASHDALTGCLNRSATVAALEDALRESASVAVAYIDLDHFKATNDQLGHAAGDELLRVVAARLRSVIRADDRLGRIGGDEFVVIAPRGDGPFDAAALGDRLRAAINGDVVFVNQRIPLCAAIGVAISDGTDTDADALLHRADIAMYAAKRRARARGAPAAGVSPLPPA